MKKAALSIVLVIGISCFLVYWLSRQELYQKTNDFRRKIVTARLSLVNAIELPERYYFAGIIDGNISLMYPDDKLNLYKLSSTFKKLDTLKIQYPANFYSKAMNIYKHVASSNVYCTNLYGDVLVTNGTKNDYYKFKKLTFDYSQALSRNSMIIRARSSTNMLLAKLSLSEQVDVRREYTLPSSLNGIIANDGILLHDKRTHRLLYMYYYRGEFLCLDTNLNLLYKAKTIDTVKISDAHFKLISYKDKKSKVYKQMISQTTPPKIVNSYMTAYNNKVYIISMLKADNENEEAFSSNQVVDVYDLTNGKYLHSFYIPKYFRKRLRQFQISGDVLTGLNGKHIVQYKFTK